MRVLTRATSMGACLLSPELALIAPGPRPALRPARQGLFAQALAAAACIHAILLALLLLVVHPTRLPEAVQPPAFTMVFAPDTPLEAAMASPSPEPQPPIAPPVQAAVPPPAPEPPVEQAPPPAAALLEPAPALQVPAPPAAAQPSPSETPTALPLVQQEVPPPALLAPTPESRPPPRPVTPIRPVRPARPRPLPRPVAPVPRVPQAPAARNAVPEAAASPPRASAETAAPASRAAPAAPISGGWRNALEAWLQAHKTYPEQARMEGTEGHVVLRFTASRDGRVLQVAIVQPSGSRMLDEAAEALLRGAHLPPFPASMTQDSATVTLPLVYQLD